MNVINKSVETVKNHSHPTIIKIDIKGSEKMAIDGRRNFLKNDFNENLKANIVYNTAKLCEFSDAFYYLLIGLNWIRKSVNPKRRMKEKCLQKMYGQYLEYFKKYSE